MNEQQEGNAFIGCIIAVVMLAVAAIAVAIAVAVWRAVLS